MVSEQVPEWLRKLARKTAEGMSILDPEFAGLLAKAVFERAGQMPEREVVGALNVCTTMAAKARLMVGKGFNKETDPLVELRGWLGKELDAASDEADDEAAEHTLLKENER